MKIKNSTDKKLKIILLSSTNTEEPDNLTIELEPNENYRNTEEFSVDWVEIVEIK